MKLVNIKPNPGKVVRDPYDGFCIVSEMGKLVTWCSFWQRRLNDGDIIIMKSEQPRKITTTTKKGANK